jgi:2-oxo-4-hydroxy-4-carboxy-5-ureidoimidazoline decarboxylase
VQEAKGTWAQCQETDWLEAFEAHPMIGDVNSLRKKFANTKHLASKEQAGASNATDEELHALSKLNHEYKAKFGFIFIICATGLSAKVMLDALQNRINNSREHELNIAAQEQLKITLLRLHKALDNSE